MYVNCVNKCYMTSTCSLPKISSVFSRLQPYYYLHTHTHNTQNLYTLCTRARTHTHQCVQVYMYVLCVHVCMCVCACVCVCVFTNISAMFEPLPYHTGNAHTYTHSLTVLLCSGFTFFTVAFVVFRLKIPQPYS